MSFYLAVWKMPTMSNLFSIWFRGGRFSWWVNYTAIPHHQIPTWSKFQLQTKLSSSNLFHSVSLTIQVGLINEFIEDIKRKPPTMSPMELFEINPSLVLSVKLFINILRYQFLLSLIHSSSVQQPASPWLWFSLPLQILDKLSRSYGALKQSTSRWMSELILFVGLK